MCRTPSNHCSTICYLPTIVRPCYTCNNQMMQLCTSYWGLILRLDVFKFATMFMKFEEIQFENIRIIIIIIIWMIYYYLFILYGSQIITPLSSRYWYSIASERSSNCVDGAKIGNHLVAIRHWPCDKVMMSQVLELYSNVLQWQDCSLFYYDLFLSQFRWMDG